LKVNISIDYHSTINGIIILYNLSELHIFVHEYNFSEQKNPQNLKRVKPFHRNDE